MPSNLLSLYINFAYYLCFVPFRVKKSKSGVFEIRTCLVQKVICGVEHFLAMLIYGGALRHVAQEMSSGTPVKYFYLFESSSSFLYKAILLKCFWCKQDVILKILNFPQAELRQGKGDKPKWLLFLVFGVFLAQPVMRMVNPSTYPLSQVPVRLVSDRGSVSSWYRSLLMEAEYLFYQKMYSVEEEQLLKLNATYSPMEIIQVGITTAALFSRYLLGSFSDFAMLTFVLTLWAAVANFVSALRATDHLEVTLTPPTEENILVEGNGSKWEAAQRRIETDLLINHYQSLRKLAKLLNEIIGEYLIPFIGEGMFTYAINFTDVLFQGEVTQGIITFSFYAIYASILLLSSNICSKMQTMKEWLYEHEQDLTLSCRQLNLLLDSISKNSVSIALSGILTISYSLVGTLVSIVITYFIVRLQSTE